MKKIISAFLITAITLLFLCSCTANENDLGDAVNLSENTLTTEEFFSINTRQGLIKNHKSYIITEQLSALDVPNNVYVDSTVYASSSSYAYCYLGDLRIMYTDISCSEINSEYFLYVSDSSIESSNSYEDLLDRTEAELTSITKTDDGYDAEVCTSFESIVSYNGNILKLTYNECDYIRYNLKLNDKYEITSINSYYVPSDGTEPTLIKTSEIIYDPETLPTFAENVLKSVSGTGRKVTVVYPDESTTELILYGELLQFYTDCEIYFNSDYSEKAEPTDNYMYATYNIAASDGMMLYLKNPETAE